MDRLQDLPHELLLLILSCFDRQEDKHELLDLCLTSKLLCAIVQSLLFSEFSFANDGPSLVYFAHTISRRPALAVHVRKINIEVVTDPPCLTCKLPIEDMVGDFRKALSKLDLPENMSSRWIGSILDLRICTLFTFVISQTPNLNDMALVFANENPDDLTELFALADLQMEIQSSKPQTPGYLSNLKKLVIQYEEGPFPDLTFQKLAPLLLMCKGLEIFSARAICTSYPSPLVAASIAIPPETLNVTELSLHGRYLDTDNLDGLLSACKKLRRISFDSWEEIGPPILQSALYRHRHTLEELRVDFNCSVWMNRDNTFRFDKLSDFTRLKRIRLQDEDIMPVGRLAFPPSLETYITRFSGPEALHNMAELIKTSKNPAFPALKIGIHGSVGDSAAVLQAWAGVEGLEQALQMLVNMLRETRISLMLLLVHHSCDEVDGEEEFCGFIDETVEIDAHGFRREHPKSE